MYDFIINPVSCSGKGKKIWLQLETILKEKNVAYRSHFTHGQGDATRIASGLTTVGTTCVLIVLGGDGTMSEVVSGIQDFKHTTLGYIPTGSSNDFARDMKLLTNPIKALEHILKSRKTTPIDIGELVCIENGEVSCKRNFSVSCGIGFDAAICHEALNSPIKKKLNAFHLGKLTYVGIALRQLYREKTAACKIYLDDLPPIELSHFHFVATMIHKYEGGGFQFCPDANCADGILDICVIGGIRKAMILFMLPSGFSGNHLRFQGVKAYRAKKVRIVTNIPLAVHTDGESCGYQKEIRMTCKNEQLQFLI